ncbi:adenine specific DNA methylase Mod [Bifidobacterium ramosum]|nr:site-specific DNA-methyltransferase [Bifidobacterium ramosum]KAB8287097.1 adenine specific DNA methylase Mod [Bifidobacterium ramosum]
MFPNVGTEVRDPETGEIRRVVDFDALREQLGDVAEGMRERYQFTWPGKRAAKEEARRSIAKTLRPVKERSKNWDETHNLYIEGDNLDALKILRETYAGKIKMIYIDPPYNTGHDFVYHDDFSVNKDDFASKDGEHGEFGEQLVANLEANGRFHSDWCSMIYPRLRVAYDLLADDGAIFISIDDNENRNLRNICDEIFGAQNFVDTIIWQKRYSPQNAVQWFSESHDFILVYAKNKEAWRPNLLERSAEMNARYTNRDNDPRGPWKAGDSYAQAGHGTKSQFYVLTAPNGKQHHLPSGMCWRYTQDAMGRLIADNRVWFGEDGNNVPAIKRFLSEVKQGVACQTIWPYEEVGHSQEGKKELKALFPEGVPFDTPKPTRLMRRILDVASDPDSVVLDFFSGSASLADAVMQKNATDDGHRKYILVQIPSGVELTGSVQTTFGDLCEIGEERIRRAGEKIKAEVEGANGQLELGAEPKRVPDIGFRVLRVDSSNYEDVRRTPEEMTQGSLDDLIDVAKSDRESLDKLFECFPTFQLPYDSSIEVLDAPAFAGHTVYSVNGGQLVACFDAEIPESVLHGMAALNPKPSYAVAAESGLKSSKTVTNFAEIFKQTANAQQGSTQIRII